MCVFASPLCSVHMAGGGMTVPLQPMGSRRPTNSSKVKTLLVIIVLLVLQVL